MDTREDICVKIYSKKTKEVIDVVPSITKACFKSGLDTKSFARYIREGFSHKSKGYKEIIFFRIANSKYMDKNYLIQSIKEVDNAIDENSLQEHNIIKLNNILKDLKLKKYEAITSSNKL